MASLEGMLLDQYHGGIFLTCISGKTSLIHSLAGELGLDIYVVSLSSKGSVFATIVIQPDG
jgi:hypothetical protein